MKWLEEIEIAHAVGKYTVVFTMSDPLLYGTEHLSRETRTGAKSSCWSAVTRDKMDDGVASVFDDPRVYATAAP